jgi:hypothetical protein
LEEEQEPGYWKDPILCRGFLLIVSLFVTIKALPSPEAPEDDLKQNILLIFLRFGLE